MSTVYIPLGSAPCETITLRASGVRVLSMRFHIATWCVRVAGRVLRGRIALVEDEPPPNTHDVAVEKIGVQMRLRIGDRAVRLDRGDARYIGELLGCGWVGQINDQRADDER